MNAKSAQPSQNRCYSQAGQHPSWITPDDLTGDIERMIGSLVMPYVDYSNPLMHQDELRAECRAKLAYILDGDHLKKCPTRAKAFGFIKTAMRNRLRSLVEKFAFAQKRTGIKAPRKSQRKRFSTGVSQPKLIKVSLNDEDYALQVGAADPTFCTMEFFEELDSQLTPEERGVLATLLKRGEEDAQALMEAATTSIREKARAIAFPTGCRPQTGRQALEQCGKMREDLNGPKTRVSMISTKKVRSALKAGDTKQIEEMLQQGLDLNAALTQDWTLLHLAAKSGQASMVAFLLDRGAKVDAQTEMRQTALDVALGSQQSQVVELLKKHGGRTGAELSLHSAVLAGDVKWVRKHLDTGADINAKSRGELPLCLALARHRWDVASLLLKRQADVNRRQDNRDMALHEAAHVGADNSMLKAILDSGADVNAAGYESMTPLCWAAHAGHEEATRFLIENGADVTYRARDGTSPASEAMRERHYSLGRFLIDKGGKCSFHQAVQCDHVAKARELLSAGANVKEEDDSWLQSPMGVAIWNDSVEMVQLLLESKVNPNEQDEISQGRDGPYGGDTPLHDAVHKGSVKMVKLLLAHGADPDIQNAQGLSPIELAKRRDQTHLVSLMEKQIDRAVIGEAIDQLYTVNKVAELLSVEEAFVTKLLAEGKLRQVKLDATMTRIPASSLRKYISKLLK
jgi:excisionase family DNA binding protein